MKQQFLIYFLICIIAIVSGCANSAQEYMKNGINLYKRKEYQGALQHFEKALEIDKDMPEIYYHKGNVYKDWNKQYDKALMNYSKAIQLKSGYLLAYGKRAQIYKLQNKYGKAITDYKKVIEENPQNARAYFNLAMIHLEYYKIKNKDKEQLRLAKVNLNKAIDFDFENTKFYRARAKVFMIQKEFTKAIEDYTKILQLEPKDYETMMYRGIAYFEMKKYKKAMREFTECASNGFQHAMINKYRKEILYKK